MDTRKEKAEERIRGSRILCQYLDTIMRCGPEDPKSFYWHFFATAPAGEVVEEVAGTKSHKMFMPSAANRE